MADATEANSAATGQTEQKTPPPSTNLVLKNIKIFGQDVPLTFENFGGGAGIPKEDAELIADMKALKDWSTKLDKAYSVKSIEVQSYDIFSNSKGAEVAKKAGFLKFKAQVTDPSDKSKTPTVIPSIVFMRGQAAAVLFLLKCDVTGELYTFLVNQARFPTGMYHFHDLPAGMVSKDGEIGGDVFEEIKTALGLKKEFNISDLQDLTRLAFDKDNRVLSRGYQGIFPSCGGCDEFLRFYCFRKTMKKDTLNELKAKFDLAMREAGKPTELRVISVHDLWRSADMKALIAICLYENLLATRKLPDWVKSQGQVYADREKLILRDRLGKLVCDSGVVVGLRGDIPGPTLNKPWGIAISLGGNAYIADSGNDRVVTLSMRNDLIMTFGGDDASKRLGNTLLKSPRGILIRDGHSFLVADSGNDRVAAVCLDNGNLMFEINHGLRNPHGVALDGQNNIVVTDTGNNRILIFAEKDNQVDLEPLVSFGRAGTGPLEFDRPTGVAVDLFGRILVCDSGNHRIQVISIKRHYLNEGTNTELKFDKYITSDIKVEFTIGGSRGKGMYQFDEPHGVAFDSENQIHVADTKNGRIMTYTPDGKFITGRRGPSSGVLRQPTPTEALLLQNREIDPRWIAPSGAMLPARFVSSVGTMAGKGELKDVEPWWKPQVYGIAIDYDDRMIMTDQGGNCAIVI